MPRIFAIAAAAALAAAVSLASAAPMPAPAQPAPAETNAQSVKAKPVPKNFRRGPFCGPIGCNWCCLTPSGSTSCQRVARCGERPK